MAGSSLHGLISLTSRYSVEETIRRLESLLNERGIKIFALVDHSGEAEKADLKMPPTKLLIFGDPKEGTPLMQAAPTAAINLPLKALFWEDTDGKSWLTYNEPAYLRDRHDFPKELLSNIAGIVVLFQKAVE